MSPTEVAPESHSARRAPTRDPCWFVALVQSAGESSEPFLPPQLTGPRRDRLRSTRGAAGGALCRQRAAGSRGLGVRRHRTRDRRRPRVQLSWLDALALGHAASRSERFLPNRLAGSRLYLSA